MFVVINGIYKSVNWTDLICFVPHPEAAFDLVSGYVAEGLILLNTCLVDENHQLELPVEVFDGEPFSHHIANLQKQWEEALQEPDSLWLNVRSQQSVERLIHWDRRLIAYFDRQLKFAEGSIVKLEKALQRTSSTGNSPERLILVSHYESLLESRRKLLAEVQISYQKSVSRLAQLNS